MMEDVGKGDSGRLWLLKSSYIYWGIKKPTRLPRAQYILRKCLTRFQTFVARLNTGSAQAGSEGLGSVLKECPNTICRLGKDFFQ